MFSRNPNEFQRQVEERSEQLRGYQDSRNDNADHHRWCQELREVRDKIANGYLAKSDKSRLLRRQRELEKLTGFPSFNYNGGGLVE